MFLQILQILQVPVELVREVKFKIFLLSIDSLKFLATFFVDFLHGAGPVLSLLYPLLV